MTAISDPAAGIAPIERSTGRATGRPGARPAAPDDLRPLVAGLVGELAASAGPVATAITPPPACYTSPLFFEAERDAVFGRTWLYLCHVSELPAAGDHLAVTVAGEPLVVTRGEDDAIRVLSALCRHRSYPLVVEDGNSRQLRCPYHYWAYGLDGCLVAAPTMEPGHPLAELRRTANLPSFPVEIFHGFVFTHLGGLGSPDGLGIPGSEPPPLAPTLAALEAELAGYRTEDLVVGHRLTLPDLPWNWKNMLENALEAYHTSFLHAGYHDTAPARLVRFLDFDPATDGAILRHAGLVRPDGGFLTDDGTAAFPILPHLRDEQRGRILYTAVPPLMFASLKPDSAMIMRILPDAVDRMTLTVTWLFPPATVAAPTFAAAMARQLAFFDIVNGQDMAANERMYRGLRARGAVRGPYSPQEATLPQFNAWLLRQMTSWLADGQPNPAGGHQGMDGAA
ncbi:aromatic ring-hydroxylating dioxygenase subunit alpha [Frankia sp. CcI49]|uniref:aromatic ring-hydroxylating oxygenase subunit alpha n=1 Tax=Frankia sp. CcI49 TaxID=1745382 RepID=UPI0013040E27|nr:aromatic ring-hydroxylating dioxygenase subunit alpha [Frankia sp. CcI49]